MLSLRSLPVRSARYHWRANVPVLLGVAVASAVLAGSLIVGDSLRGSLRDQAERQLGGVGSAMILPRLIPEQNPGHWPQKSTPTLLIDGSARGAGAGPDVAWWPVRVIGTSDAKVPVLYDEPDSVTLSAPAAARLRIGTGDTLELRLEKSGAVPRSSLLGRRGLADVTAGVRLKVTEVLPPSSYQNDFSLLPNPTPPLNVFVPLTLLQKELGEPGKVNAVLAVRAGAEAVNEQFREQLNAADYGLRVRAAGPGRAYISVESESLILDGAGARAAEETAKALGTPAARTYSYLANAVTRGTSPLPNDETGDPNATLSYSTVGALDPTLPAPLGPFLPPGIAKLADDEIVLARWPGNPLETLQPHLAPGDPVTLTFFQPEMEAKVSEGHATFRFAGWLPLAGAAADPDLTPPFPGITDKLKISEWDSPFPVNNRRVRPRDEQYWEKYKATPKAYVTRAAGEKLWGSRFGDTTSVRIAVPPGKDPEAFAAEVRNRLPAHLDPAAAGLVFEPVLERLLAASQGGTDFGALLVAFGMFLIGSALLLVALLFRLSVEQRAKEVGLLLAAGYGERRVRRLLLTEGLAVAAGGALLGLLLAAGYAAAMIEMLARLWPTPEVARVLRLHVGPGSLVAGFVGTVLMAGVAQSLALRGLVKVPAPALLRGVTEAAESTAAPGRGRWMLPAAGVLTVLGVGALAAGPKVANPDFRAMAFFNGGGMLLLAGLLVTRRWLHALARREGVRPGAGAVRKLGLRNAGRNPGRSILAASLIAVATFLLVAVESFRRRPDADFLRPTGGSGGYRLLLEASVPLFEPFTTEAGRDDLLDQMRPEFQRAEAADPAGPSRQERLKDAEAVLATLRAEPFRLQAGDDASCLNLFQAGRPRVLGVPDSVVQRGGFAFAATLAETDEERANPWLLLAKAQPGGAVPCFAEQNSVMWMLKTSLGGTVTMPDAEGRPTAFRIVGTLQDSVFQSELLVGDAAFRRLYPRQEGFRVFLVDCPPENEAKAVGLLQAGLRAHGARVTPTLDRVAAYQKVVGTYLTTFQLLGGLGLLLGVLGLGVVVLRAVWERAGELALLRAVGYRTRSLQGMVLAENAAILLAGLGVGLLAAGLSVLPNLSMGGSLNAARLAPLLGGVLLTGLSVAALATRRVAAAPIVPALRGE